MNGPCTVVHSDWEDRSTESPRSRSTTAGRLGLSCSVCRCRRRRLGDSGREGVPFGNQFERDRIFLLDILVLTGRQIVARHNVLERALGRLALILVELLGDTVVNNATERFGVIDLFL